MGRYYLQSKDATDSCSWQFKGAKVSRRDPTVSSPSTHQHADKVFQHDNARPHTARATVGFLANHNVTVLPWPSKSPDLNPIENLWDQLDKRVRMRQPAPQTLLQLQQALQEEWQRIPQVQIQRLIQSMRRRVTTVLQANGGHTRY